jgi:hypothetical protein
LFRKWCNWYKGFFLSFFSPVFNFLCFSSHLQECELYRVVYNKMSGPNSSEISEIWLPSLRTLDDEASRELLARYEIEAVSADELLHNLNEFHLSSALNYAVFQNFVCLCIFLFFYFFVFILLLIFSLNILTFRLWNCSSAVTPWRMRTRTRRKLSTRLN